MAFSNQYLIDFFKQRMVELYDNNTLDSYSVRTCNSMSMFYELQEILEGWIACNVKKGTTVAYCIEECIHLLEDDEWLDFSFYDRKKLIKQLEDYQNAVSRIKDSREKKEGDEYNAKYMLNLVSLCITANETSYLVALISSVRVDLLTVQSFSDDDFTEIVNRLDKKLSFLATELLRRGYSKSFLYYFFKSIKQNEAGIPFVDAFDQFQSKFSVAHQYIDNVIIRLNFPNDNVPAMENMFDEVPVDYMEAIPDWLKGHFKKTPRRRFYIVTEVAADTNSASQKARIRLSQALDRNGMGAVHISNICAVSYIKDGGLVLRHEMFPEVRHGRDDLNRLPTIMRQIDESDAISQDIKVRLNTAMRHLRVGDDQTEIEQCFLNYWIGLEFIFSTPRSGDSTFTRLMDKFPTLKTLFYLKRNVSNLDSRLREKDLLSEYDSFGNLSEADMDVAFNSTTDILLKYRIKRMKSHLHYHDKVKEYLDMHIKNLKWHLSRIYHYRNELVHEAAIKNSIEGVSNNLRSYLVFILNLLIDYCIYTLQLPNSNPATMDNFFWHYELLWNKITPEYDKDRLLALKMPESYVR